LNTRIPIIDESGLHHYDRQVLARNGVPLLYAHEARSFWQRFRGVKAFPKLGPTDALIIKPCSSIHTIGLTYSLDVLFVGVRGEILKAQTVKPYQFRVCLDAALVIEMCAGTIDRLAFRPGQRIVPENELWQKN